MAAKYQWRGIKIDPEWCAKQSKVFGRHMDKALGELRGVPEVIALEKTQGKPYNPNSPIQTATLLKTFGIHTYKKRGAEHMSTRKDDLELVEDSHPFVGMLLRYKERVQVKRDQLDGFIKFADKDNIIHPYYNPIAQVGTRMSCSEPNAKGISKDPLVRGMVISRFGPGGMILEADYKSLEIFLAAALSQDAGLLEIVTKGLDLHDATATKMFGQKFDEIQRRKAKSVNFGSNYGQTKYGLSRKLGCSLEEAESAINAHQRAYPGLWRWVYQVHSYAVQHGHMRARTGHIRHLDEIKFAQGARLAELKRQAQNYPITTLGAAITNYAGWLLDKALTVGGFKSISFHEVSDALLVDVYPGELKRVEAVVREVMEVQAVKISPIQLKVEIKSGPRWS